MANAAGDPSFQNVVALLHCDGANGSTTFTDSSPAGHTFTPAGGVAITTAQKQWGTGSLKLTSTVGAVLASDASEDFALGDYTAYTIEGWAQFDAGDVSTANFFLARFALGATTRSNLQLVYDTTGGHKLVLTDSASVSATSSALTIVLGTKYHWAWCVNGSTSTLYWDGTRVLSTTTLAYSALTGATCSLKFGSAMAGTVGGSRIAYMDDLRATKAVRRYSAATLTVPTAAFPDIGLQATGWKASAFGAPKLRMLTHATSLGNRATFGTPSAKYTQLAQAQGWSASIFGTGRMGGVHAATGWSASHFGAPKLRPAAVGWSASHFGTPSLQMRAHGWNASHFGAPTMRMHYRARSLGRTSRFGTPTSPIARTFAARGHASSSFGTPTAIRYLP